MHRALRACTAVFALALLAPGLAIAQSGQLGPGPFSAIRVKPKALVFDVDRSASDAKLLSGTPTVSGDMGWGVGV
jgi:hypothetical protein